MDKITRRSALKLAGAGALAVPALPLLGRAGVLSLSIVANANQFPDIFKRIPAVIELVTWKPGFGYDAYQADTDVRAPGGLDTLITGAPRKEPEPDRGAWWWLVLLPVTGLALWLHRRLTRGLAGAPTPRRMGSADAGGPSEPTEARTPRAEP